LNGTRENLIGQRVPVHFGIVREHVFRPFRFAGRPRFDDRQPHQNGVSDAALIHVLNDRFDAIRLLKKVDKMQVCIRIAALCARIDGMQQRRRRQY
jgi:hypothetical protein